MDSEAAALGAEYNIYPDPVTGKPDPTAPAFTSYNPAPYLRPFYLAPGRSVP
jgi:hypothetical protein